MNVLVLGNTGQLATELRRNSWPLGWAVEFAPRDSIDLRNPKAAANVVLQRRPALVINAAAYTAVDKAESEPEAAMTVNALAPEAIAVVCAAIGAPFMTVSTDYVFDGLKKGPYREDDPVAPASVYGRSKAEGEDRVRHANPRHLILRTSWVFSAFGTNFVRTMLKHAAARPVLSVVDDQCGKPTAAGDLASAIIVAGEAAMRNRQISGTYHVANSGVTTWYKFASAIFESLRARGLTVPSELNAIATSDYPTAARRPANSELDCTKFEQTFLVRFRNWRLPLEDVLDSLTSPQRRAK